MNSNNSVLSRFFTQNSLNALLNNDSDLLKYIVRRYNIHCDDSTSNQEIISEIYGILQKNYRNEYFYKNTLLNKLIINVHRLKTTTALTEIPISKSIADIIMINGKAVVYEIKTELDTFERLDNQISDYFKAFDHVCVVTSESQLYNISKHLENSPVGIYILTKRGNIKRVKEPQEYKEKLDKDVIFKILNKPEYKNIVEQVTGSLPDVTPVKYYTKCKEILCNIEMEKLYKYVLQELKKRNKIEVVDITNVPQELRFLMYFSKSNKNTFSKLEEYLERSYMEDK